MSDEPRLNERRLSNRAIRNGLRQAKRDGALHLVKALQAEAQRRGITLTRIEKDCE